MRSSQTVYLAAVLLLTSRSILAQPPVLEVPRTDNHAMPVVVESQQPAIEYPKESPPFRGLDSNLYMQTSAEYRACCLQAFNWAAFRVKERLAQPDVRSLQPAVVLDLDETVLDNREYQTEQLRMQAAFDPERWANWEQNGKERVGLIPGAKEFLLQIKSMGVQPVYITNRNANSQSATMEILKAFELDVPDDCLLCADEKTGSNKTSRRAAITERFDVILLVGDNLRDFDELFRFNSELSIEARKQAVDQNSNAFGDRWVILPNPAYGEWNKVMGTVETDLRLLSPTIPDGYMPVKMP